MLPWPRGGLTSLTVVGNAVVDHLLTVRCPKDFLASALDQYRVRSKLDTHAAEEEGADARSSVEAAVENMLKEMSFSKGVNLAGLPCSFKNLVLELTIKDPSSTAMVGGSALNTARAASKPFAGNSSPPRVRFVGAVGEDSSGELIHQACLDDNVLACLYLDRETRTGECAVLVNGSSRERTICCSRGASGSLSLETLETTISHDFDFSNALLFATTFVLTTKPRFDVVDSLAARHRYLALSLSSAELILGKGQVREHICQLLRSPSPWDDAVCIVFGTKEEIQAYVGSYQCVKICVDRLMEGCVRPTMIVVVTDGPKDVTVGVKTQQGRKSLYTFQVPPLEKKLIVNTNGAGDSFAGGFLGFWMSCGAKQQREVDQVGQITIEGCVAAGMESARTCLMSA